MVKDEKDGGGLTWQSLPFLGGYYHFLFSSPGLLSFLAGMVPGAPEEGVWSYSLRADAGKGNPLPLAKTWILT